MQGVIHALPAGPLSQAGDPAGRLRSISLCRQLRSRPLRNLRRTRIRRLRPIQCRRRQALVRRQRTRSRALPSRRRQRRTDLRRGPAHGTTDPVRVQAFEDTHSPDVSWAGVRHPPTRSRVRNSSADLGNLLLDVVAASAARPGRNRAELRGVTVAVWHAFSSLSRDREVTGRPPQEGVSHGKAENTGAGRPARAHDVDR